MKCEHVLASHALSVRHLHDNTPALLVAAAAVAGFAAGGLDGLGDDGRGDASLHVDG